MRVAFSGAHRTGKTTLLEAVAAQLPGVRTYDEPYWQLEEEGHEFSDPPSREDFEHQLRRSIETILAAPTDALLDRSPVDFVAYLRATANDFELDDWWPELGDAMAALDALVLVTVEVPDRSALPPHEDARLRRRVDEEIGSLLLDDPLGLGARVIEVHGDVDARVHQVMRALR